MASVGHACKKMVSIIYAVMRDNKAYTPCIPNEISARQIIAGLCFYRTGK